MAIQTPSSSAPQNDARSQPTPLPPGRSSPHRLFPLCRPPDGQFEVVPAVGGGPVDAFGLLEAVGRLSQDAIDGSRLRAGSQSRLVVR